jgi:hypothetical protein
MGLLEFSWTKPGLSDDGLQSCNPDCIMVGNQDGDCAHRRFFLHDYVASPAAYVLPRSHVSPELSTLVCRKGF